MPDQPDHADALWYKDAIIYQAHVRAFFDTSNDGVGDFPGLTQKLDYLQSLGVNCLWLMPFYPSPLRDDGYDIADYENIHPSYGTLDDFDRFIAEAHRRGLRVVTELVINHTSDQHPWFQAARRAPAGSPERDFYVWSDTNQKYQDVRIIFTDTETSNWRWDDVAKAYYWHRFFNHQPDLNFDNPAVLEAVIKVMQFWLDRGVDGLRLDAIPYLIEREGTICENLEETHNVLKKIRAALDSMYPDRMLLAEANQWPADVRPYFADGDECHMAFHFPLMPRMFMGVRQEDRHPITEILRQTPDIPDNCQWAMFLRNHDELTLEMVTDEERDYMYQSYAADPQMRINVGIRRRLAPLLENSRRRIELLHGLLFSMPGTPVLYYGDEIGMGDNIYLGDRNGVRTPMQWSSDRNGGFSRADPARLYAPPIQDPVYGYQAINVEAQERFPFSMLNWMKRLVAMRKQHRVFGRGSIEFVGCPNRKVLGYLRRDDRETILIVVNLSRAVQPAELDLRSFAGLVPTEMNGLTEFPRIGEQPYFLTLGPYASYWFTLQRDPMQVSPRATAPADPNAAILESLPALLIGIDWQNVLDGGTRAVLERQALRPFLERQRWFASKSREIRQARFTDWAPLRKGATPSFLTIASVEYTDGRTESYFMPLSLLAGEEAQAALKTTPANVLARVTGARKGAIVDGLLDDDTCERLLALVERAVEIPTSLGIVEGVGVVREARGTTGVPNAALGGRAVPLELPEQRRWVRGTADQSNSVAIVEDRYVLKAFRRIEPTPNPEFEIGRFLAERGFARTPVLVGALQYLRSGLEPGTLAVVQGLVTHQGSGWEYSIDELRRYYERIAPRVTGSEGPAFLAPSTEHGPPPLFEALEHWYLAGAATLGRRTAELHLTLASGREPAFAPEPLDRAALGALRDGMREHGAASLDLLAQRLETLNEASRAHADAVLSRRKALLSRFDEIRSVDDAGQRIRIHGDYHLGQVLRTEEDFIILDFEGEPARSIAERRAKQSPLKDVAGMIRSYSYAAYAALIASTMHARDDDALVIEPWADTWQHWAADAFLKGYTAAIEQSALLPRSNTGRHTLLSAFILDKAFYELGYELDNRPDWVRIPLIGIRKLIGV
jgi:maltose alpha-D-glucosyltransferase / alpha-amylase